MIGMSEPTKEQTEDLRIKNHLAQYAGETERPTRVWICGNCNRIIERWRGEDDIQCECGAWYNTFGQRLRDDWQGNPSNYDSDIGDMEGFEVQQLRKEL